MLKRVERILGRERLNMTLTDLYWEVYRFNRHLPRIKRRSAHHEKLF